MKHIHSPSNFLNSQNRIADDIGPNLPAGGGFDAMYASRSVWQDDENAILLTVEDKPLYGPLGYERTTLVRDQFAGMRAIQNGSYTPVQVVSFPIGEERILVDFEVLDENILSQNKCYSDITPRKLQDIPHTRLHHTQASSWFESRAGYN